MREKGAFSSGTISKQKNEPAVCLCRQANELLPLLKHKQWIIFGTSSIVFELA